MLKFRNFLILGGVVFSSIVPEVGHAGSIADAKVISFRVDQDGRGMVFFDKNISGSPPCINAAAYPHGLAFDTRTPGGKAILAFAMQARSMGSVIAFVWAPGTCTTYGGHVEDWGYGVGG